MYIWTWSFYRPEKVKTKLLINRNWKHCLNIAKGFGIENRNVVVVSMSHKRQPSSIPPKIINYFFCQMGSIFIIFNFKNVNYQSVLSQQQWKRRTPTLQMWFASGEKKWNQSGSSRTKVTYAITKQFSICLQKKKQQMVVDGAHFNFISSCKSEL